MRIAPAYSVTRDGVTYEFWGSVVPRDRNHLKNKGVKVRQCRECYEDYLEPDKWADDFCSDFCLRKYEEEISATESDE